MIAFLVPGTTLIFIIVCVTLIVTCVRHKNGIGTNRSQTQPTPANDTTYISEQANLRAPLTSANGTASVYLVNFDALPPDFDFTAPGVEIRDTCVALKDMSILPTKSLRKKKEYNRPPAYNPFFA